MSESIQEKLIFDDGRKVNFKIKINNFPFLLKRKIELLSNSSGHSIEDVITMMLDNEVESVEKILGEQIVN